LSTHLGEATLAKRFLDTDLMKQGSYRRLRPEMKLALHYLKANCDHAGLWQVDMELMAFQLGWEYALPDLLEGLVGRITLASDDTIFVQEFIEEQYGDLDENNRVHSSVIRKLLKFPKIKPLIRPLLGCKDKDIDMDILGECEGETKPSPLATKFRVSDTQLEEIYDTFPRKKGKAKGFKKARDEIKSIHDVEALRAAVSNYRQDCIREKTESRFIKHFSTFMAEWRDWIDPSHGSAEDFSETEVRTLGGFASV
jgi:hypothetical protein